MIEWVSVISPGVDRVAVSFIAEGIPAAAEGEPLGLACVPSAREGAHVARDGTHVARDGLLGEHRDIASRAKHF